MSSNQEPLKRLSLTQGSLLSVTDVKAWTCFVTEDMLWGGGLNKAIVNIAGGAFDDYVLDHVVKPKAGEVFCLPAFNAPVDHIVLGVLPVWRDGLFDEEQLLIRCYKNIMKTIEEEGIDSVAMASLGSGKKGFPQRRVVRLTVSAIIKAMPDCLDMIRIICRDETSFSVYQDRLLRL